MGTGHKASSDVWGEAITKWYIPYRYVPWRYPIWTIRCNRRSSSQGVNDLCKTRESPGVARGEARRLRPGWRVRWRWESTRVHTQACFLSAKISRTRTTGRKSV